MELDLTDTEAELVREILQQAYQDLREEIYKTEGTDYKATLKGRERTLESVLQRLRSPSPDHPIQAP
jgi:hypothetical protein